MIYWYTKHCADNGARKRKPLEMVSLPRTQVLLTNVEKELFQRGWHDELELELFSTKFPHLKPKLSYYSPLPFLGRIIIIFKDEQSARQVHDYLIGRRPAQMRVYLTKSLLSQRSNSEGDMDKLSDGHNRPILSVDTGTCDISSPSLSPDHADSSRLLKFDNDSEYHLYQEPLPKNQEQSLQSGTKCLWQDLRQPMSPSITLDEFKQ